MSTGSNYSTQPARSCIKKNNSGIPTSHYVDALTSILLLVSKLLHVFSVTQVEYSNYLTRPQGGYPIHREGFHEELDFI